MAKYITPSEVVSPKKRWGLIAVLDEGTEGGSALAIGRWDGEVVLAMRWNGEEGNRNGNPQSRGLPTWFIVDKKYYEGILQHKDLARDKVTLARNFFPGR
ncbi:MAG: hypothetical protein ABSH01_06980 [Terriglobia bacterium]|jgi:hypothetical protein